MPEQRRVDPLADPPRGRRSLSKSGGVSPRLQLRVGAELHWQVTWLAASSRTPVALWVRRALQDAVMRQYDAPWLRPPPRWSVHPLPYETGRVLAVVLAGGASSRMGGGDKTRKLLAGRSLLDHVLGWLPGETCIVVGEPRPLAGGRAVIWCREEPPGAGPVAAVQRAVDEADCRELPVARLTDDEVVLLAGDAPLAPRAVPRLRHALATQRFAHVALLVDERGRRQHLCAVWRWRALRLALSGATDGSMRSLLLGRDVVEVPARGVEALDCDRPEDLAALEAAWREPRRWPAPGKDDGRA